MYRFVLLSLLVFLFALPTFAQFEGPGVFVLEGFSSAELSFQPMNGERVALGQMAPTAARIRRMGDQIAVLHGDSFVDGTGSAIWLADFEEIRSSLNEERHIDWEIFDLPDDTNPYDILLVGEEFWVSNQQSNNVVVYHPDTFPTPVAIFGDMPNPQGLAYNGSYVCVANSAYGYGNTVCLINPETHEVADTLTVWDNPQEIAVDDQGRFHVACSGRSWDDVPAKSAIINFPFGNPTLQYIDLAGNPGEIAFMTGPEDFGGKMVFGDEYATTDDHISAYTIPELQTDESAPGSQDGGWALAPGQNGIFVGSSVRNSLIYMGYDWGQYTVIHNFDDEVADLLYFDAGINSAVETEVASLPGSPVLSAAWPNPFNAQTSVTITLPQTERVKVELFDLNGRLTSTLLNATLSNGVHRLSVNSGRLTSGVYFLRASTSQGSAVQRITLVR